MKSIHLMLHDERGKKTKIFLYVKYTHMHIHTHTELYRNKRRKKYLCQTILLPQVKVSTLIFPHYFKLILINFIHLFTARLTK